MAKDDTMIYVHVYMNAIAIIAIFHYEFYVVFCCFALNFT